MRRRLFLKTVGGAAAGITVGVPSLAKGGEETVAGLPRRVLGRTGWKASVVTFPGLSLIQGDQERGTGAIHDAVRRGEEATSMEGRSYLP